MCAPCGPLLTVETPQSRPPGTNVTWKERGAADKLAEDATHSPNIDAAAIL